jgi:hypothetical protein
MNTCQGSSTSEANFPQTNDCINTCRNTPCQGNSLYCNTTFLNTYYNISTGACLTTGDCYCRRGTYAEVPTDISATQITDVVLQYYSFNQLLSNDLHCSSTYSQYLLQLYCNGDYNVSIVSQTNQHSFTGLSFDFQYMLPYDETTTTYPLTVSIYPLNSQSSMYIYQVYARLPCDDIDCFLCAERFSTFSCMSSSGKWMFVLFLLFLITLFLTVIYMTFWPILMALLFAWGCLKTGYTCSSSLCCCCYKRTKKKVKEYIDEGTTDEKGSLSSSHGSRGRSALPLMALVASGNMADACTVTPIITSLVPTCSYSGSNLTCTYNLNALITIPTAFDESCIQLSDANGNPFADIRFNYGSFNYVTQTSFSYFTSDFICISQASKSCWTPTNWCGATCDQMLANDTTGHNQLSDASVTTCPGITKCTRTCGCASCSCFYCDSACTVFRWAIEPKGTIYSVYQINGYTSIPNVTINITMAGKPSTFLSVNPFPGIQVYAGVFNVTQIGTLSNPTNLNLNSYGVISDDTGKLQFFNPISAKGTPVKLAVGDVQYSTRNQLTCGTSTGSLQTVFDPAIGVSGETSVTCEFSGVSSLTSIPQMFNGYQITTNSPSTFKIQPPTFPPIQIGVATSNLVLSQIVDFVCPVVEFVNVTGCYTCSTGFDLLFNIRSKCVAGPVLISSPDCVSQTIGITSVNMLFNISCQSNTSFYSDTVTVQSNTAEVTFVASGALLAPQVSKGIFGSNSTSGVGSFSAGFDASFLTNSILGIPSTLGSLWKFIINIVLFVVCFFIAYCLIKFLWPKAKSKIKTHMVSQTPKKEEVLPTSVKDEPKISSNSRKRKKTVY